MKIPQQVERELEATGLPWDLVRGGQHIKIRLSGKFVGISPSNGKWRDKDRRAMHNIIAQIRRAAKELKS